MRKNRYTYEQLEFLRIVYRYLTVERLTDAFNVCFVQNKTVAQIKSTLANHCITCGHKKKLFLAREYTPDQELFLRSEYTGRSIKQLTEEFNSKFGTDKTEKQIMSFVHNRGITSGRTGHFEKGSIPWNAGTKGKTRANKTSFKKGSIPPNRKPLGHERTCSRDGYILIKIAEENPYTGAPTRYKQKHVHLWESVNGPVPDGMTVIFKDGDKTNITIDNLSLVSRAELLRLNQHRYRESHEDLKPSIMALSKLEVQTFRASKKK